jgi:hypothetical protein
MGRPSLQALIKSAMAGAASRVDVSLEAAQQIANAGGVPPARTKTASAHSVPASIPTEVTTKLAAALDYVARQLDPKLAEIDLDARAVDGIGPGEGPGALEVTHAETGGENIDAGELGSAKEQPPKEPALQKDPTRPADPGTGLETNDSAEHAEQPEEPISNERASLTNDEVKAASAHLNNLVSLGLAKVAYDNHGRIQIIKTSGALGDAGVGALAGGALGAATGLGAGTGAKIGAGLGAAKNLVMPKAASVKTAKSEETELERKGRRTGSLVGGLAGGAAGLGAGKALGKALGSGKVGRTVATLGGGAAGMGIGSHVGGRLGRAAGTAGEKGLDKVDPKGKKEASIRTVAALMAKSAAEEPAVDPQALMAAQGAEEPAAGGRPGLSPKARILLGLGSAVPFGSTASGALLGKGDPYSTPARGMAGSVGGSVLGGIGGGLLGQAAGSALGHPDVGGALGQLAGGAVGGNVGYDLMRRNEPKVASIHARNLMALGLYKQAEDAINPAQISAGKIDDIGVESPDGAVASGEGAPAEPADVNAQKRKMISSNEAAINYTRRDAKGDPKQDLGDILSEPALSAQTDKTLDRTLDNTDAAGAKISSARYDLTKAAAARAILSKIAEAQTVPGKKTKRSAMGGAPSTPQAASGFSAGSGM